MSDENIDVPVVDLYKEHSQHQEFLPNCSECYDEQKKIDEQDFAVGVNNEEQEEADMLELDNLERDEEDYQEQVANNEILNM